MRMCEPGRAFILVYFGLLEVTLHAVLIEKMQNYFSTRHYRKILILEKNIPEASPTFLLKHSLQLCVLLDDKFVLQSLQNQESLSLKYL
jgi:hypothetical protein